MPSSKMRLRCLFRLVLGKGFTGARYHAVAEQGVLVKDIWTLVGKLLQRPVQGQSWQEAVAAFGLDGQTRLE